MRKKREKKDEHEGGQVYYKAMGLKQISVWLPPDIIMKLREHAIVYYAGINAIYRSPTQQFLQDRLTKIANEPIPEISLQSLVEKKAALAKPDENLDRPKAR